MKISKDILDSDEAIVAVMAHEMHELNGLRKIFQERETLPAEELGRLINPGHKGQPARSSVGRRGPPGLHNAKGRKPMIKELAELVEMYEQGAWSRGDYFHRITLLVLDVSIDELVHELPMSDRDEFVRWLRDTYDSDTPVNNFISIGQRSDTTLARERIDVIRRWLRANPRVDEPNGQIP